MKSIRRSMLFPCALLLAGCVTADEQATLNQIQAKGARVLYVAKDAKEYTVTIIKDSLSTEAGFTVADAKQLGALKNAVEIALRHPDADDAWVQSLKGLAGLKKLHLENTKITDRALATVGGLAGLEYLNLYGTAITDNGLDQLKGLKNLKSLYLWQTKVTEAKAKAFQDAMAKAGNKDLSINLGVDKDFRSVNTLARLTEARAASEVSAREAAAKAAKAEMERIAAIKTPTFDKDILPILKRRCIECHGSEKQKGKLRLDSFAELSKGADGEPVFVAGKPGDSSFHARIVLPDSDDDRMPPKGNRLSDPVAELIKRWIEQGAKQK